MAKRRDQSKWRSIRVPVRLAEELYKLAETWESEEVDIGATIDTPGRVSIALHEVIAELLRRDIAHRMRARRKPAKGSWRDQRTGDDQDDDQEGDG